MNILFIPTKDPQLTNGGNEQRTHLLWNALKSMGKVYTFMPNLPQSKTNELIEGEHPIYMCKPIYSCKYRPSHILNTLSQYMTGMSLFSKWDTKIPKVDDIFSDVKFDIVVCRYIHNLLIYDFSNIAPLYIDVDDHPFQVFETTRKVKLGRILGKFSYLLLKNKIESILSKSSGGWIANKEQLKILPTNYAYLPNVPNSPSERYNPYEADRCGLITIGAMSYPPNYQGVDRFIKEIWPVFHQKYPDIKYTIGGKGAPTSLAEQWNNVEGVRYVGFIDNLEEAYQHCLATVVPIDAGGGTCIKTLESLSYSRTCLSSAFGARGILDHAEDGRGGLHIYTSANSFIGIFLSLQDKELRLKQENYSRDYITKYYSVDGFKKNVKEEIIKCQK